VLGWLENAGGPRTHAEVVEGLEAQGWDRATLFRNLTDLVAAGLVRRLDVGDHVWRFELVDEADQATTPAGGAGHGAAHAHFVCTDCGEVQCLPALQVHAPEGAPARVLLDRSHEIQIRGVCAVCEPIV
jgi:Fur family ferric uptake transcriptional regulator